MVLLGKIRKLDEYINNPYSSENCLLSWLWDHFYSWDYKYKLLDEIEKDSKEMAKNEYLDQGVKGALQNHIKIPPSKDGGVDFFD